MSEEQTPKTYDIPDVEIFETGKWNGDEYNAQDLDEIVEAFTALGGKLKPYVKLGHDPKQAMLQKDGMPAAGWITGLKRVGNKLVANMSSVPEKIYNLIQSKAYGRFSSEIFWNLKDEGKTYRRALKAVALLGADTPAVTSLDDFINLYTESEYEKVTLCTHKEDIMEVDVKQYELKIHELDDQLKSYAMKIEENEKALAAKDEQIKAFEEEKTAMFTKEVGTYLESSAKEGKISPAQKNTLVKLCTSKEQFETVKEFIANQGQVVPMGETSKHREVEHKEEKSEIEEFDARVAEFSKKHPEMKMHDIIDAVQREGGK
jgi:hypothetical protein